VHARYLENTSKIANMSGTSPHSPSSPNGRHYPTRTVGIIKNHALSHRLGIERKIIDAGFDIIKERQMEFSADSDREVLEELFGNDSRALNDAPIWVYVLERHRAIETLHSLMGSEEPSIAREHEPHSIRALYGLDEINNAFGGSADSAAAEAQIGALFASSPPFPTSELPAEGHNNGTVRSVSSSVLDELHNRLEEHSDAAYYASSVRTSSNGTPSRKENSTNDAKTVFRARPVPATNVPGAVQPRMTKAAALRMGIKPPTNGGRPRQSSAGELAGKRNFIDVPGHKRSQAIPVASTAAPTIAPRPTRASSLREGKPVEVLRPRQSLDMSRAEIFKNVPGHKRTETVEVQSVKEPIVKPRSNRSASLRQTKEAGPPSSYMFKGPVEPKIPPALALRRSSSSLGNSEEEPKPAASRRLSMTNMRPPSAQQVRPPSSVGTPEIAPRSNRSAMLRAAKMAATPSKATRV